jgi:ABC-type phosphate transport system permease subunit
MSEPVIILAAIAGILAVVNFLIYTIFSRWWQTWSGRAYWSLFASLIFMIIHFIMEQNDPALQNEGRETFAICLIILALAFNLAVMVYKRWFWTPAHDVARDARRARRIAGRGV